MKTIQIVELTTDELSNIISDCLKKHFKPKEPTEYITRAEVSDMLKINLSSVHNWTKKGILTAYQIGGKVYYKRAEVEGAIVELKK